MGRGEPAAAPGLTLSSLRERNLMNVELRRRTDELLHRLTHLRDSL
jgi:hypothetical protein